MLARINRLKNTKDINRVFKEGKGRKEGFLFLKLAKNDLGITRFAFIVSRKTAGKATARNKIKRRLREAVRKILPRMKAGFDVVVVVQKEIENKKFQEIEKLLWKLLPTLLT